jgi:2-phospho-L-lactate guanylyltransferase
MWAIVPLKKELDRAKQRLTDALSVDERAALMVAMIRDVLTATTRARGLSGVLLVSRAEIAEELTREFGIELFVEAADADLSESVQAAAGYLMANRGAVGTMILHGDLPLVTAADLNTVLDGHKRLSLVPDTDGEGTNCIVSTPPNLIRYRFGFKSFKPHVEAAYDIGITPRIVRNERIGLDVDTPEDLVRVIERIGPSKTRTYLESSGIASRLGHPHNRSTPARSTS